MGGSGSLPLIRPGATFPKGEGKGCNRGIHPSRVLAQGFAGRRGRRPLRVARELAAAGACPHPALGYLPPKGEGKSCCWRRWKVAAGGGTPPYGWGYGNARGVYADTRSRAAAR